MKIKDKVEYWENKLLDLGKRNKMISCSEPKHGGRVSRATLLIKEPNIDGLWDKLVVKEGSVDFPIDLNAYVEGNEDDKERLAAQTVFQNGYQTDQSVSDTCKTLISIKNKAKEFMENKGMNALYLTFGFLNWRDNGTSGDQMRSPLLLLPVMITQESIASPIKIAKTDDDPICNNALQQKLKNDFNISIPEYEENEPVHSYLNRVESECEGMGWKVDRRSVQLLMLSYLKMAMFHDIRTHEDAIAENPIVRTLNGEPNQFDNITMSNIHGIDHDAEEPKTIYSVVDADSSQQDAITLAKAGVSFVLQGPPGTGKSQTITNFIAELLGQNKKVLFVSEKMAALEVVYSRLKKAGLGDFCLTLHNPDAKRKEIIDQLKVSVDLSGSKATLENEAFRKLESLKIKREALNEYDAELHRIIQPLGESIFQVNGHVAKLDDYPDIDFRQENADKLTPGQFERNIDALSEYSRIVSKSGYQNDNPWYGCNTDHLTHQLRQKILSESQGIQDYLSRGAELVSAISELITGEAVELDRKTAAEYVEILKTATHSPTVPLAWLEVDVMSALAKLASTVQNIKDKQSQETLIEIIKNTEKKSETDLSEMLGYIADNNDTALNKLSDVFRSDCGKLTDKLPHEEANPVTFAQNDVLLALSQFIDHVCNLRTTENAKSETEQKLAALIDEERSQKEQLNAVRMDSEAANKLVTELYNETILDIDALGLKTRFDNNYKSSARILNSQYRKDMKLLKSYSRINERISYKDAVILVERLNDSKQKKRLFDEKTEIVNDISENISNYRQKIAELSEAISCYRNDTSSLRENIRKKSEVFTEKVRILEEGYEQQLVQTNETIAVGLEKLSEMLVVGLNQSSDLISIHTGLKWIHDMKMCLHGITPDPKFMRSAASAEKGFVEYADALAEKFPVWESDFSGKTAPFIDLFTAERKEYFLNSSVAALERAIRACCSNLDMLETLIDYQNAVSVIKRQGLEKFLSLVMDKKLEGSSIVPVYQKCFYRSWLDDVAAQNEHIFRFRRERQESTIEEFKELDKYHLKISREMLKVKLIRQLPDFNLVGNGDEAAVLKREINKKAKLMPIRKLIAKIPSLLPSLKPCMLMSPLSVSTYFGNSDFSFDTVIFDEASQVRTEDAICSIFRAKQVIIAGDSHQLPPTDFFSSSVSDNDEYDEETDDTTYEVGYESLLDEAAFGLATQTLLWHYRSKHEHLIAFSNRKIYDGKLITFPSSVSSAPGMGVEYVYVENGIYDRGGHGGNVREAKRIAELLLEHFRTYPERSVGIIAFGSKQQEVIENEVIKLRRDHPEIEHYFGDNRKEPLFIRNLESVQGDERDTIIFSIGYGYDMNGKFTMNFGPLSRDGGERRLNVAITRARYNLKLVGSILPTDIKTDRITSKGPGLLRDYIDFAMNGENVLKADITTPDYIDLESPFEEAVYEYLVGQGYNVATQVGCSGYRIDLGVYHPNYNGRFVLGIECDGASYHSAKTARERDRLRQTILEDMGWKIYRIWSTDWIKATAAEKERLKQAVDAAIAEYSEKLPTPKVQIEPIETDEYVQITEKTEEEARAEVEDRYRSYYAGGKPEEIPTKDYENTILKILNDGYGSRKKDNLIRDAAKLGYGWQRVGSNIKREFNIVLRRLERYGDIEIKDDDVRLIKK